MARFCLACGTALAEPEPIAEEERKVITALFTDIVGSTAAAERMDPEDVRARLAPYYARVRAELEAYGGTVEKFIGDAVVALFGAPIAHEDDPKRAVRAALAVRRAVEDLNARDRWLDIHVRTAIHTGEALIVLGASAVRGEGMAAGDVMNTAARLQSAAPIDGIVVGEATHRATSSDFEYGEGEPLLAKGKAEPIPVWVLLGERAPQERPAVRTPLVGRREELELLTAVWERTTSERRPQLVSVLGQPGIGKSRLLAALAETVEQSGAVHWGRCLPYGEGITYWPMTEIVKSVAGIRHDDDQEGASAKLGRLLESLPTSDPDELRTIAAAAANLLGDATTPRGTYATEEIGQAELHWGVRRVLELLAMEQPVMLVLEDLHWAEPTLLELVLSLTETDVAAPIMVVGSARPELKEAWPASVAADRRRSLVELSPLGEAESRALLAELVGPEGADGGRLAALVRNAGGNPLFLEETVRMLADATADPGVSPEALPVPENLQALIGSRLDALAARDKRVAQQASVAGEVFWAGAVGYMGGTNGTGGSNGQLSGSLATLERRDFVRPHEASAIAGDREYEFKHILIRDVAYDRVPKGRRAELHVRFADWVAAIPGPEDEFVEILAYHLEQACRLATSIARSPIDPPVLEATVALARAADRAQRREGWREAARYYDRALELIGDRYPDRAVELRLPRARARLGLGEIRAATEELEAVAELAGGLGRLDLRSLALVILANVGHRQGRPSEARSRATEARRLADVIGDQSLGIRAVYSLAAVQADYEGMPEAAVDELRRALRVAEEIDDRALRVEGHLRLGFLLFNVGELAGAEAELGRCIELASDLGSLRDEARATFLLGLATYYRGDLGEAERLNLQARDWLDRTAEPYFQMQNFRALGLYALARDEAAEAERWLREAIPVALEEGGRFMLEVYRYLAEALVRQDRTDEAATTVEFAGRNVPEEDVAARGYVLLGQAAVQAARGERAALETYEAAIGMLEQQRLPLEAGEARIAYADAFRRFDDAESAAAQLWLARETLERFGATALARRIGQRLE